MKYISAAIKIQGLGEKYVFLILKIDKWIDKIAELTILLQKRAGVTYKSYLEIMASRWNQYE